MQEAINRDFEILKIDAQHNYDEWGRIAAKRAEIEKFRMETYAKMDQHSLKIKGILENFTNFFSKVFNWTLAIISADKVNARDLKTQIETELNHLEITQKNDKFREILDCAELIAESAEYRYSVEKKLKISPSIKIANEKARNKAVKPT